MDRTGYSTFQGLESSGVKGGGGREEEELIKETITEVMREVFPSVLVKGISIEGYLMVSMHVVGQRACLHAVQLQQQDTRTGAGVTCSPD